MPSSKLTGVYFGETVSTLNLADAVDNDEVLQFVVQTSTAIADYDDKLTLTDLDTYKTKVDGKGLTETTKVIESIMTSIGRNDFYVYSVKTNTAAGWKEAVTCGSHLKEIKKVLFYEENAITGQNAPTVDAKMTALAQGCHTSSVTGGFRIAYVIPQKTIDDAVAGASNVEPPATVVTTFTSLLTSINDGRLVVILPDGAKEMACTIATKQFFEEIGYGYIEGLNEVTYNFTATQLVTLRNLGIVVPRPIWEDGVVNYEIELGVTTSYSQDAADGQLVGRTVADELLRQVDTAVRQFIKQGESESNVPIVQTAVNDVIADFKDYVVQASTTLKVADAGNRKFTINGTIKPIATLEEIDVNTILS